MLAEPPAPDRSEAIEAVVARAAAGDRSALETVMARVSRDVHRLARRFVWHPQDAEDASQEVLIRVMTGLGGFRGESSFATWVYRVACNTLIGMGRKRMEQASISFEDFAADLAHGLAPDIPTEAADAEHRMLLEEVKIGCTQAMLLCLDRDHRMAYILGEIIGLDHREAAAVLDISAAAYRKRLSRANADITNFMSRHCGLVESANACRCRRRVATAVRLGRVDAGKLRFATSLAHAQRFPQVLAHIRTLESAQRAAALYKSHPDPAPSGEFFAWLRTLIGAKDAAEEH